MQPKTSGLHLTVPSDAELIEQLSESVKRGEYPSVQSFPEGLESAYQQQSQQEAVYGLRCFLCFAALVVAFTSWIDSHLSPLLSSPIWDLKVPVLVILVVLAAMSGRKPYVKLQSCSAFLAFSALFCFGLGSAAYATGSLAYFYVTLTAVLISGCLLFANFRFHKAVFALLIAVVGAHFYWASHAVIGHRDLMAWDSIMVVAASSACLLMFYLERSRRRYFLLAHFANIASSPAQQWASSQERVRFLVSIDKTTGVADRNSFDRRLKFEWHYAKRKNQSLSLLLLDVSACPQSEDVLCQTVQGIKAFAKRPGDLVARFAADKVAILLVDTELTSARWIAHKILVSLESELQGTVNIGVASVIPKPGLFASDLVETAASACQQTGASHRIKALMSSNS